MRGGAQKLLMHAEATGQTTQAYSIPPSLTRPYLAPPATRAYPARLSPVHPRFGCSDPTHRVKKLHPNAWDGSSGRLTTPCPTPPRHYPAPLNPMQPHATPPPHSAPFSPTSSSLWLFVEYFNCTPMHAPPNACPTFFPAPRNPTQPYHLSRHHPTPLNPTQPYPALLTRAYPARLSPVQWMFQPHSTLPSYYPAQPYHLFRAPPNPTQPYPARLSPVQPAFSSNWLFQPRATLPSPTRPHPAPVGPIQPTFSSIWLFLVVLPGELSGIRVI